MSLISRSVLLPENWVLDGIHFTSGKNKWMKKVRYPHRKEAGKNIFKYIEIFYNRQRRHAYLDYMTPVEFEEQEVCN
jgi:putative transposase